MVMLFTTERICNCERIPDDVTCSLKNPWRSPGVLCSNHTQTSHAPFTYLCQQGWILGEVKEKQPSQVRLFQRFRGYTLRVLHLVYAWLFPVIDRIHFEITKHINSVIMSSKTNDRKVSAKK